MFPNLDSSAFRCQFDIADLSLLYGRTVDLKQLTFNLLFSLCAGFFISLGVLKQNAMGKRYYLYHGLGAAILALAAFFVLNPASTRTYASPAVFWFAAFCTLYSVSAGSRWWLTTFFYAFGAVAALYVMVATWLPGLLAHGQPLDAGRLLLNGILSGLLMGFTMAAMLVGHWYLVQPKLSIHELKRTTVVFVVLVILRFLLGTAVVVGLLWGKSEAEIYTYLFAGYPGLFITMRWVWGLLAPLVLLYFIWNTVSIRSTQSATGILYVAVLCVLAGETLSQYLALVYRIAL